MKSFAHKFNYVTILLCISFLLISCTNNSDDDSPNEPDTPDRPDTPQPVTLNSDFQNFIWDDLKDLNLS